MITATLIALAVLVGYVVTVACSLGTTFALTSARPGFVAEKHRITAGYKRLQAFVWAACVLIGAMATFAVADGSSPLAVGLALTGGLIAILWLNTWEARQRGLAHQIILTVFTVAGVFAGHWVAHRLFKA